MGGPRKQYARGRRAGALIGSAALHVVILGLILSTAAGELVSSGAAVGGAGGPVFTVTVVRLPSAQAAATPAAASTPIIKLKASAEGDPLFANQQRRTEFTRLMDRLRVQQPPSPQQKAQTTSSAGPPNLSNRRPFEANQRNAKVDGEMSGQAVEAVSTGALWGAVEPCWRNLGVRGRVPVALEVSLDGAGGLRKPPTVLRSNAEIIDEPRLQAEASALAALAACLPRSGAGFGTKTYRLEFPAAR